jgi:hypothetical protein
MKVVLTLFRREINDRRVNNDDVPLWIRIFDRNKKVEIQLSFLIE